MPINQHIHKHLSQPLLKKIFHKVVNDNFYQLSIKQNCGTILFFANFRRKVNYLDDYPGKIQDPGP